MEDLLKSDWEMIGIARCWVIWMGSELVSDVAKLRTMIRAINRRLKSNRSNISYWCYCNM